VYLLPSLLQEPQALKQQIRELLIKKQQLIEIAFKDQVQELQFKDLLVKEHQIKEQPIQNLKFRDLQIKE